MKHDRISKIITIVNDLHNEHERIDERLNLVIDKLNYLIHLNQKRNNQIKTTLNSIYGVKLARILTTRELYETIPYCTFDLSINGIIVKSECTWGEFFDMRDGIYAKPFNSNWDLKTVINNVIDVELKAGTTDVNLIVLELR